MMLFISMSISILKIILLKLIFAYEFQHNYVRKSMDEQINVREYRRRGNQKWIIQRNRQHRVQKTKQNKNTTQYVLDTIIRKQTQIE